MDVESAGGITEPVMSSTKLIPNNKTKVDQESPNYITSKLKCRNEFLSSDTIAVYEKKFVLLLIRRATHPCRDTSRNLRHTLPVSV